MRYLPRIRVKKERGQLIVSSPYHPEFVSAARNLSGIWDPRKEVWVFDPRIEDKVREKLIEVYGWDGTYPVVVAQALVKLSKLPFGWAVRQSLWLLGRELASRAARDARVRLGSGVILEEGGFPPSGGSRKYPGLFWYEGTALRVLDVPVGKIERDRNKYPEAIEEVPKTREEISGPNLDQAVELSGEAKESEPHDR